MSDSASSTSGGIGHTYWVSEEINYVKFVEIDF